jgi:hypothetical protein
MSKPRQSYRRSNRPVSAERERQHTENPRRQQSKDQLTPHTSRDSNRILGDYTLDKTLGVGRVGEVKLAQRANSDEKVYLLFAFFVPIKYS